MSDNYAYEILDDLSNIRSVDCIFYYGRSGTYLLASLLDDHPEILMVPPYALREEILFQPPFSGSMLPHGGALTLVAFVEQSFPGLFDDFDNPGEVFIPENKHLGVDRRIFGDLLYRCLEKNLAHAGGSYSPSMLVKAIHVAYCAARGREIATRSPVIIWSLHNPSQLTKRMVVKRIPDYRFLTMVRCPEKTLDSQLFHISQEKPFSPNLITPRICVNLMADNDALEEYVDPDRSAMLRFEDLHGNLEGSMRAVASWLGIRWDASLLFSSMEGVTYWWRNNRTGNLVTGVTSSVVGNRSLAMLSEGNRMAIRYAFEANYKAWGYEDKTEPSWWEAIVMRLAFKPLVILWWRDMRSLMRQFWQEHRSLTESLQRARKLRSEQTFRLPRLLQPLASPERGDEKERSVDTFIPPRWHGRVMSADVYMNHPRRGEWHVLKDLPAALKSDSHSIGLAATAPDAHVVEMLKALAEVAPLSQRTLLLAEGQYPSEMANSLAQAKVHAYPRGMLRLFDLRRRHIDLLRSSETDIIAIAYNNPVGHGYGKHRLISRLVGAKHGIALSFSPEGIVWSPLFGFESRKRVAARQMIRIYRWLMDASALAFGVIVYGVQALLTMGMKCLRAIRNV